MGSGDEKQTRTLTNDNDRHHNCDAEDYCEDVCIELICGWSVGVLSQQRGQHQKYLGRNRRSSIRKDLHVVLHLWINSDSSGTALDWSQISDSAMLINNNTRTEFYVFRTSDTLSNLRKVNLVILIAKVFEMVHPMCLGNCSIFVSKSWEGT